MAAVGADNAIELTVLMFLFVLSTVANSVALLVFTRRPGLRTISNRFVMNLLGTNIATTTLLAPTLIGERVDRFNTRYWSAATDSAAAACSLAALLAVLLISIDQHHAVTDPLRCHAKLLQRRPNTVVVGAWLIALFSGITRGGLATWRMVSVDGDSLAAHGEAAFAGAYLAAGVIAPTIAVCIMYVRIYKAARSSGLRARAHCASALQLTENQPTLSELTEEVEGLTLKIDEERLEHNAERSHCGPFLLPPVERDRPRRCPSLVSLRLQSRREARLIDETRKLPIVNSAPTLAAAPLLTVQKPASGSRLTAITYRISNASLFRYREESRAARIGVLTGLLVLLHAPHALVALTQVAGCNISLHARTPAMALLLFAATISPFLFALRSRHVQREARRMLMPSKLPLLRSAQYTSDQGQARAALDLLQTLTPAAGGEGGGVARGSFSSGASTQMSSASED